MIHVYLWFLAWLRGLALILDGIVITLTLGLVDLELDKGIQNEMYSVSTTHLVNDRW